MNLQVLLSLSYVFYLLYLLGSLFPYGWTLSQSMVVTSFLVTADVRVSVLVGSLSNDDADGNENGKKAIGLISKTTTLHVHHAFFVHFFAVIARLQRESA